MTKREGDVANMVKYFLSLCVLFIIGCAGLQGNSRLAQFEDISYAYGQAIRWGDYEMANGFRKKPETDHETLNVDKLDKIRVTSYKLLNSHPSEDKLRVHQDVKIRYFKVDQMIEKTLIDRQLWEYDDTKKAWYLQSGSPDFR